MKKTFTEKISEMWEIFWVFFRIGALTFGGGYTMLPLLQKDVAQKRGWVSGEEIIDYYAISQSLPGLIAINTAMLVGYKKSGMPGLAAAMLGVACPSIIVILSIAVFISNFLELKTVGHAFNGIRVAVAALIVKSVIGMWKSGVKDKTCFGVFLAAFLAFELSRVSPVLPVLFGAMAGIAAKEFYKRKKVN